MKTLIFALSLLLVIGLFSSSIILQENKKISIQEIVISETNQKSSLAQESLETDISEETKSTKPEAEPVIERSLKSNNKKTKSSSRLVLNQGKDVGFSPNLNIDLSNYYHYQSTSILFYLTPDVEQNEVKTMSSFFNKGFVDLDKYNIDDRLGFGHVETLNGSITYELKVSDKLSSSYTLSYDIIDSSNPYYPAGGYGVYGMIANTGDNMNFSAFKLFEDMDDNNITDVTTHFISLDDGLFRNPEPGIIEVENTFTSMNYEIYTETQEIEISEFTSSYCSLMHGMFEVSHNSGVGEDNYDERLDLNEDDYVGIQDLAIFAANYEDEFWCAYQITPL